MDTGGLTDANSSFGSIRWRPLLHLEQKDRVDRGHAVCKREWRSGRRVSIRWNDGNTDQRVVANSKAVC